MKFNSKLSSKFNKVSSKPSNLRLPVVIALSFAFLLLALVSGVSQAQATTTVNFPAAQQHSASVSWTAPTQCSSSLPCTFQVYRAVGACPATLPGSPGWVLLTPTPITAGSYVDQTVAAGTTYAYGIYASQAQSTGPPQVSSGCGSGTIPLGLGPVVNVVIAGQ